MSLKMSTSTQYLRTQYQMAKRLNTEYHDGKRFNREVRLWQRKKEDLTFAKPVICHSDLESVEKEENLLK